LSRLAALDLGAVRLHWLDGGGFRVDGGALFGPVPRRRWSAAYPPADDNTVPLTAHVVVVEDGSSWGLIDTGFGHHLSDRQRRSFSIERESQVAQGLVELGLSPVRIDWIVLSHLHLDHAGGLLASGPPAFPNARVIVQALDVQDARDESQRGHDVYAVESLAALSDAGLLDVVDGETNVTDNVRVFLTGGHCRGHQGTLVQGATSAALHLGDVLVTSAHLSPGWVSAFDDFPLQTIQTKREWLARAAQSGWWIVFSHDVRVIAGRLDRDGRLGEARTV
jgi:glyoxylase-like metal-dependent hydrolase (beta-lactamase superfamily II)